MLQPAPTHEREAVELEDLRARLREAADTLEAIRQGDVDALLINDGSEDRVYTLRSADAPYRALVEQMQEGAVTLNQGGDIIYANQSFARLAEAPLEQVIGSPIHTFIDLGDRKELDKLMVSGEGSLRTRLRTRKKAHPETHISVSEVQIDDVRHLTLIVTDLTTLRKVQRESQSKDEFLAMLAHELRNPLAPIRTGLQVLRLSPKPADAERAREMMDRQLAQMVRLIDDLLDVSRVSRGKIELRKEPTDLRTVIGLAVETSLPLIEAGRHELVLNLPPELIPIQADPTRLAQVFGNLLNNAAKYTPDGGRLEVIVRREDEKVHVRIADNGVGIPEEMLPEVFEMFSQVGKNLDRSQGGLGIGLTLVRRLTQLHGGSVTAESHGSGSGSVFTVCLPLDGTRKNASAVNGAQEKTPMDTPSNRLRVLIVDDNVDGAEMLAMLVGLHGHETEQAHHGLEVLEKVAAFEPQVVFLDIGLPGLDGYEVARRLRASEATRGADRTTLVALTGWGSSEDKEKSKAAGFDLHLTKPIDAKVVEALLNGLAQPPALTTS